MINADKGLITTERLTVYTVSLSFYKESVLFVQGAIEHVPLKYDLLTF